MGFWSRLRSRLAAARGPGPEAGWEVAVSDEGVACTRPDGSVVSIAWADLKRFTVMTTDEGPFRPDVFWVLSGDGSGCFVPQGAKGGAALLERLQALPGFDNEAFVEAMASTSLRKFVCWERGGAA